MALVLGQSPSGLLLPGQVGAPSPATLQYPPDLFGYWSLSQDATDFTAGTALDLSLNANHGTFTAITAASVAPGQVGSAVTFNGTSSLISVACPSSPNTGQTFALWVKFTAIGAGENSMMIERDDDNSNWGLALEMQNSNVRLNITDTISVGDNLVSNGSLSTGIWYHICGVWDGTSIFIYINGVYDSSKSSAGTSGGLRGPGTHYTFGGLGLTGGRFFSGAMNEVRVYGRGLDSSEIGALYHAGLEGRREVTLLVPQFYDLPSLNTAAAPQLTLMGQIWT